MFRYSNEYGFLYARNLFSDYLSSDFCDIKEDCIELTEDEFKEFLKARSFKEFIIAREQAYLLASRIICEKSYDYDEGFGSLLELNVGKYETISNKDEFYLTDSMFLTRYIDPTFFIHEEIVIGGYLDTVKILSNSKTIYKPVIRAYDMNDNLNMSDIDTLLYLNEIDLVHLLTLLKYCRENDKTIFAGIVTNVFDKNVEQKVKFIEEVYEKINDKVDESYNLIKEEDCGSVIRLIHTL